MTFGEFKKLDYSDNLEMEIVLSEAFYKHQINFLAATNAYTYALEKEKLTNLTQCNMTREEAKTYLENYRKMYADLAPERFLEALDCILSQPSLPSDLDEAAKKIVIQLHPSMEYSAVLGDRLTIGELTKLVKAGAEWMAGQGVVLRLSIDELSCGAYNACVEQGLTSEDDVIVQIRKK